MPADDKIIVNVRLLPEEPPTREHPHLTRFQLGTKRDATREKLALECHPGDTVAKLKQMIEDDRGEAPEILKRGGAPGGIALRDDATLAECGITRSMSVWEHIWEDAEENQASFKADVEKVKTMVHAFMHEHPDVGRHGPEATGQPKPEKDWDDKKQKQREEMEAAVEKEKQRKRAAEDRKLQKQAQAAEEKKAAEKAAEDGFVAVEKTDAPTGGEGETPAEPAASGVSDGRVRDDPREDTRRPARRGGRSET